MRSRWSRGFALLGLWVAAGCGDDAGMGDGPQPKAGAAATVAGAPAAGTNAPSGSGGAASPTTQGGAGKASSSTAGASGMAAAASAGSSASGSGAAAGAGGTAASAGSGGRGSDPNALRVEIKMPNVTAGDEDHVCVTVALPNQSAIWVKSLHATLTPGSHHLIVDRMPAGSALQTEPASCPPTMGGDASRLIIAQQPQTQVDLPAGTAFRLEPRQPIYLQLHYINYLGSPMDIGGVVELQPADASGEPPIEVKSRFTGATSLMIPRGEESMGEFFLSPAMSGRPVKVFALTSHTHSLGVRSTIERVANRTAPDQSPPIHESLDWAEPPLTTFEPPLMFDGSDGLRLRCYYKNDTDHDVRFGTRFEDEMCFMWLYYFDAR